MSHILKNHIDQEKNMNRRNLFKTGLMTVVGMLGAKNVLAAACKAAPAPVGKKLAKIGRLDYVLNAADAKSHKKFKAGSTCGNCKFYKKDENGYAKCAMMANKYVAKCGWCKSWKVMKKKA